MTPPQICLYETCPNTYSAFLVKYPSLGPQTIFIDALMGAEDLADTMICVLSLLLLLVLGQQLKEKLATIIVHVADISSKEGCRNHW